MYSSHDEEAAMYNEQITSQLLRDRRVALTADADRFRLLSRLRRSRKG